MKTIDRIRIGIVILGLVFLSAAPSPFSAQERGQMPPSSASILKTPLPQSVLDLLANEISGQMIFNNEVKLAGAPWKRDDKEFGDTFYESRTIHDLVRGYGVATSRIDKFPGSGTFDYPDLGELWMVKPEKKLIARVDADPALVSRSSADIDLTGTLVYIPPLTKDAIEAMGKAGVQEKYKDKIALMWSHANQSNGKALDAAGIRGVITFAAQDRFLDPDQVLYSGGAYGGFKNLQFGLTVSWRQWSELLEEVERGAAPVSVQCKTKLAKYPNRFEDVFSWIPGREPDKKGVIFTAHLFEGFVKRGANDNMSGCVVQLEILRALSALIARGELPQPRRTIYFLWPVEISGTYEFIKQNPGFADTLSIDINMDMVGESLRLNNGLLTMSECPNHLPSYLDGLTDAMLNYVWRTNDIVYTSDSPRSRLMGQNFPRPMWEKNGSRDAFRYFVHAATGGSDHVCFNNAMVAVPGIELFTWPDQWYHADKDTPDKSDPTEMKRVAFIGAAAAWAAANCTDEVLPDLLSAVSSFGYARVGKRELPAALRKIDAADAKTLPAAVERAVTLVRFAAEREWGAIASVADIATGSVESRTLIANQKAQWAGYLGGLTGQIWQYAKLREGQLKAELPPLGSLGKLADKTEKLVPAIHPEIRGKEFALESSDRYRKYMEKNPDALKEIKIDMGQRRIALNYVNGQRPLGAIWRNVKAETDRDLDPAALVKYMEFLKEVGWVTF